MLLLRIFLGGYGEDDIDRWDMGSDEGLKEDHDLLVRFLYGLEVISLRQSGQLYRSSNQILKHFTWNSC